MKILVVDDNERLVKVITRFLARTEHVVFTATDTASGFDKALREKPHLIIADYNLPDKTGLEMLEKIQRLAQLPADTRYILMSGRSKEEILHVGEGVVPGPIVESFLAKPFTLAELNQIL